MTTVRSASGRATGRTGSALDDPSLLGTLVKSAKSSHSTLGRALDTTLSHQRFGGAEMEPSALTMNHRERERQLRLQQEMQRAYGDAGGAAKGEKTRASTVTTGAAADTAASRRAPSGPAAEASVGEARKGGLFIPALPTTAPSMTAAADDGTESLGGTRIGGEDRGYVTLIGAVPTFATTRQIEDNYELISSFRAYRSDAQRVERQAALRNVAAPHPDLLVQLAPLLQQRGASAQQPQALVDVETLPYELRQLYAARLQSQQQLQQEGEEDSAAPLTGTAAGNASALAGAGVTEPSQADAGTAPQLGTWSFTCQGRAEIDRVKSLNYLPGQRQPAVGQYYVRYTPVEARVTGGYITPQVAAPPPPPPATTAATAAVAATPAAAHGASGPEDDHHDDGGVAGDVDRSGNDGTPAGAQSLSPGGGGATSDAAERATLLPGENVKGSSMFISRVPRQAGGGSAAPDVCYWPYPDVRSTAKRAPCLVQLDVPQTHRRREPLVSGVPASVYDVCGDIAADQPRTVTMDRSTGRATHWYGRTSPPPNGEPLDVDAALLATRAKERAAVLPPRSREDMTASLRAAAADTSVSVERNTDFPRPLLGDPARLSHVRDFGKMRSRAEREAQARLGITEAYQGDRDAYAMARDEEEEAHAREWTEARSRAALIHPAAPGHQALHTASATELGNVPSLALTKPRAGGVTDLGKGSVRPAHMAPLHDLTYDTERGHALTGSRVKGTPSIGRTVPRQKGGGLGAEGCGAKVMYNPTDYLAPAVKSVPDFEKQITKEHEFRGHRVQSERYRRLFPSAPGPGHYSPTFSQVE